MPITLYNVGGVMSIATIAYLGADQRNTSAYATFMVHRSTYSPQSAHAGTLEAVTESVALDDARTEAILRHHLKLTPEQWKDLDRPVAGMSFSAEQAVAIGLADEIAEFRPTKGAPFYHLNP